MLTPSQKGMCPLAQVENTTADSKSWDICERACRTVPGPWDLLNQYLLSQ